MSDTSWIAGLMRHNYEAVGFLPLSALDRQYIANDRYIIQSHENGNRVGYLLHGKPTAGGILSVAQHCIEDDKRLNGYGQQAFEALLERARQANCRAIKVRCAQGLPSNDFWRRMGLAVTRIDRTENARRRAVNVMLLDLYPGLWERVE